MLLWAKSLDMSYLHFSLQHCDFVSPVPESHFLCLSLSHLVCSLNVLTTSEFYISISALHLSTSLLLIFPELSSQPEPEPVFRPTSSVTLPILPTTASAFLLAWFVSLVYWPLKLELRFRFWDLGQVRLTIETWLRYWFSTWLRFDSDLDC